MKNISDFITEAYGGTYMDKRIVKEVIKTYLKELSDHLRDEKDLNRCPEMDGNKTWVVIGRGPENKLSNLNTLRIRYSDGLQQVNHVYKELEKIGRIVNFSKSSGLYLKDYVVDGMSSRFSINDLIKPIKIKETGQTYSEEPGPGNRSKDGNFEKMMGKRNTLREICTRVAENANLKKDADILKDSQLIHVGKRNTRTYFDLDRNTFSKTDLISRGSTNIADYIFISPQGLAIGASLKNLDRKNGFIANFGTGTDNPVEREIKFLEFFLKDKLSKASWKDKFVKAMENFYPENQIRKLDNPSDWLEIKMIEEAREDLRELREPIDITKDVNGEAIEEMLRFAWGLNYYVVVKTGSKIHGFYMDEDSLEKLTGNRIKSATLHLPVARKHMSIKVELQGDISYEIRLRDRNAKMNLNTLEITFPKGENVKRLTGYSEI